MAYYKPQMVQDCMNADARFLVDIQTVLAEVCCELLRCGLISRSSSIDLQRRFFQQVEKVAQLHHEERVRLAINQIKAVVSSGKDLADFANEAQTMA